MPIRPTYEELERRIEMLESEVEKCKQAEEVLKRSMGHLQHAQRMAAIGTLAGGIAHEFNNILGIIVGNTQLAMDDIPEGNMARNNLEEILTASLRGRDVVKQILAFSRLSEMDFRPIAFGPIVRDALKLLRASIPTTIEIRQDTACRNNTVMADPTQIHQVLINLCTNAAHAMGEEGGVLDVRLDNVELDMKAAARYHDIRPGSYLRLSVTDTGHGIEPDKIERIFDPYFTTKKGGKGAGMGLAVVHGIVKNHGGDITVNSEPGKGTAFHVLFPTIEDRFRPEVPSNDVILEGSERILFVDDEEALVSAAKNYLEDLGYKVVAEKNPVKALKAFKQDPDAFDLVITDMTMPDITGDRLAKEIMQIRPHMPVILCTGFSEKISEVEAKEMGIKAYIMKPALVNEMATAIRFVLSQQAEKASVPKRILVVDDEAPIRAVLKHILEDSGYEVSEAANGKVAARLCREKHSDLMITDLIMPEKEGIETIMEVKRDFPEVKIIAISGGGQGEPEGYLRLARKLGAERSLSKPFKREELLKTVKELL